MGFVVLPGLFEPGTVVELFQVEPGVVRVDGAGPNVGHRVVDERGVIGFDGLEPGRLYIARGLLNGVPTEVRARALDGLNANEITQPPVSAAPQLVGTQEQVPVEPAKGTPGSILHVGVPAGLPLGPPPLT